MYTTLKFKQKNLSFFFFWWRWCANALLPLAPTLHTHHHAHTLSSTSVLFYRQNPQKHLLSRSKCQLIISPKHVFNWSTGEQLESGFSRHGARRMKTKVGGLGGGGGGGGGWGFLWDKRAPNPPSSSSKPLRKGLTRRCNYLFELNQSANLWTKPWQRQGRGARVKPWSNRN